MIPAFKFELKNDIVPGISTVGKYDGRHPCLTCATKTGKVIVHDPSSDSNEVQYLNINRSITALTNGKYKDKGDTLFIGTKSNLLAYNVVENSDIYYKDISDGVNALAFGKVVSHPDPMVVVGGNCSIQGFDSEGNESFWTVAGDNVAALAFGDATGDGVDELIVGSDDYEIRSFQNEDIVIETTETGKIVDLTKVQKHLYAYALDNGTVGLYKGKHRAWRMKSKNKPIAITGFDLDGDGETEVLIGWDNGKFEVRRNENGKVIYKNSMHESIAALQVTDYRLDGRDSLLCCSTSGKVQGYVPGSGDTAGKLMEDEVDQDEMEVQALTNEKYQAATELKALEVNLNGIKNGEAVGSIPSDTSITVEARASVEKQGVKVTVSTNNNTIIKCVTIFDHEAGMFEGESYVELPATPSKKIVFILQPNKNVEASLKMNIFVGHRANSNHFHIFEETFSLPKFSMYMPTTSNHEEEGYVKFSRPQRYQKMEGWLRDSFLFDVASPPTGLDHFKSHFKSVRDNSALTIELAKSTVKITTASMRVAADIVQDLASYLELDELESTAHFPKEMDTFQKILLDVDDYNATRVKLTAEMADESNQVKNLVIKGEDARMLGEMQLLKSNYAELFTLNNQLIGEYTKRSTNHLALLDALKQVNAMIQVASRLRIGTSTARVVKACRSAVKENNIHALFYILQSGQEER